MIEPGELLPDAEQAIVSPEKLAGYVLNPAHTTGTNKARVFYATLELGDDDWEYLRDQILGGIRNSPVTDARPCYNGTRCSVVVQVLGRNGRTHPVMTGWRVPDDGTAPHLTTAFVLV